MKIPQVPLDYTKRRHGRSYIPIIKYPATATPYKGMVLTNPGGPGGSGVDFVLGIFDLAVQIVGRNYDFVSWDPRGVNNSIPVADCKLSSDLTGTKLKHRTLDKLHGLELAPIFFQDSYAQDQEIGRECGASIGGPNDAGPSECPFYTSSTAHDVFLRFEAIVLQLNAKQALSRVGVMLPPSNSCFMGSKASYLLMPTTPFSVSLSSEKPCRSSRAFFLT
jgi:pimeloyl-ACP methyl ester carboxylesterase